MLIITSKTKSWNRRKDELHRKRKEVVEKMKPGMMSRSQMMKGHDGDGNEMKQVEKYDNWKDKNKNNINQFHDINREFKEHSEEGRKHTLDDVRQEGKMKYD